MDHILVVEDTPNFQRWLVATLQGQFPETRVSAAGTAQLAREALEQGDPALLILDLGLPEHDGDSAPRVEVGLELLERLKATGDLPRIIVLSGHPRLQDECLAKGADGFVSKDAADVGAELVSLIESLR